MDLARPVNDESIRSSFAVSSLMSRGAVSGEAG